MRKYLIVGCGVAGISAAETIRHSDPSGEITITSDDPHGFYSRPGLAYYLTGELPRKQLHIYSKKDWQQLNVRFLLGKVSRIDSKEHHVVINHADVVTYDRLLLATGASAVRPNLPGINLLGVVYLDDMQDAQKIIRLAHSRRSAIVVGGGILALELVEGLRAQGMQVHFFLRGNRYWPNILDETESRLIETRLTHEGIHIHTNTEITSIMGRKNKVVSVHTSKGDHLPCSMVAFGIGVQPRIELALSAGLDTERGILLNDHLQTNQPDIFSAGDVAQIHDPDTGKKLLDLLWHPARVQGHVAGLNMTGLTTKYKRSVAVNVLRLAGIMTTIIGAVGRGNEEGVSVMRGSSETWQQLPNTISVSTGGDINLVRLLIGNRTLKGAVVMGEQILSQPLQDLIGEKVDISSIRPQLLPAGRGVGQLLMEFWYTNKNKQA